jgi:DNA-binding XRE family transcriptional regulator
MTLNKKPTTWEDIRSSITVLTQEEWDEIDLKVKIVGEILKARQDENLTQRALEELSGIKQPVIARIENGKTDPQLGTVLKILRPLGKTLAVVDMNRESRV